MIVITTPTGRIGHQVLDRVIDAGQPVRVIARDPSRLAPAVREKVEVIEGSHSDPAILDKAFAGADVVFWLVPPNPRAESVTGYMLDFSRPAAEAVKTHGVKRVVAVSTLGHGVAKNAGQVSAALAMDEQFEASGVAYRALSMPGFMENMMMQAGAIKNQNMFFLTISADRKVPTCATRDIADVAAKLLLDDSWSGQSRVPVLGPEDLSPADQAEILSEVLGRPIRFQQVPEDGYKANLLRFGMTDAWAQGLVDMAHAVDEGIYNVEERTPENSTSTSFRLWAEQVLKPAVS